MKDIWIRFKLETFQLRLKLAGKSDTYATVNAMKSNIEKIDFFKKVVISSTTNDKADNTVKFKLKIEAYRMPG